MVSGWRYGRKTQHVARRSSEPCLSGRWKEEGGGSKPCVSSACGCAGGVDFLSRAVNSEPYGKHFTVKEKTHFLKPGIRKKRNPKFCTESLTIAMKGFFLLSDHQWLSDLCLAAQNASQLWRWLRSFFLGWKLGFRMPTLGDGGRAAWRNYHRSVWGVGGERCGRRRGKAFVFSPCPVSVSLGELLTSLGFGFLNYKMEKIVTILKGCLWKRVLTTLPAYCIVNAQIVFLLKDLVVKYVCMHVCVGICVILVNKYFKYSIVRAIKMNKTNFWLLQIMLQ